MKKKAFQSIGLYITLTIICTAVFPGSASGKEFTYEDFWWLAGEADLEHATYAPSEDITVERKYSINITTIAPERHFVGDEPLQIHYKIFIPQNVSIDTESFRQGVQPFEIVALHTGKRTSVKEIRDIDVQRVTITALLPSEHAYGTYTFPSLEIPYEYEIVAEGKSIIKKSNVSTRQVTLEKVPIYLDVVQVHTVGFISDIIPFTIEIHADNAVNLLNEYPPERPQSGIMYLSEYIPREPFALLGRNRTVSADEHYRVIEWRYYVGVQDIDTEAFTLGVPHVVWQEKEKRAPVKTITPEPVRIEVRKITKDGDIFKPVKGIHPEPSGEQVLLLTVPSVALVAIVVAAILWISALSVQSLRRRKKEAVEMPERRAAPEFFYDRWPWQKWAVRYRLSKAREAYQGNPNRVGCTELRALLVRRAAIRLQNRKQISIQEAYAKTASELEQLVGLTTEINDIRELDKQLETGEYRRLP